ncbi:ectonucleotide pyrophosphatase/phosphodiesterase [Cesiribacter sp. SM1]|uniref:alkaline phosphatase family protein n=1 Tax=Cesiribacter sp. SM1 TaxID=2861196 RepID=UPI001CD79CCF|nr:ectonucleotide pyrophosphatase/phosphodiesterase [Cesiribacter sp. SM1]
MQHFVTFIFCLLWAFSAFAQADTTQRVIYGRKNSHVQEEKPYVIMISADGFRHDYAEKYGAHTLLSLSEQGVQTESMIPSFPSKTFPNHYTLVTGLYPAHHGLVSNNFYDRQRQEFYSIAQRDKVQDGSWYGGVPLWVLAEQQQMLTASYYWVGSEAAIKGIHPTYYYRYSDKIPVDRRIQTVVDWLNLPKDRRPHFISFYFPEVDYAGHRFGPNAKETKDAVLYIDHWTKKLTEAVATTGLPVNFIFVSDHGMTEVDTQNTLTVPVEINPSKFTLVEGDVMVELHAKDKKDIRKMYEELKKKEEGFVTYLKSEVPYHLHYGAKNDSLNRIGDIVLLAKHPKIFNFSGNTPLPGHHGYDPVAVKDMNTVFYAWGPAFRQAQKIASFENIHVYSLVTKLLGLPFSHHIDGTSRLAELILKQEENKLQKQE